MNTIRVALAAFLACVLIAGAGAAPDDESEPNYNLPPVRPDAIARLAVDGEYAYINKRPAYHGSYVFDGDNVSTGAATSATLVLNDGGTIQLDERTDPDFKLLKKGFCLLTDMVGGQIAIRTKTLCVRFQNKKLNLAGVANSVINLRIDDREAWLTVLEGRIEMMSPRAVMLATNDRYIAASDGTVDVQRLTRADAAAAGAWRQKFFRDARPRPEPPPERIPPAADPGIGDVGRDLIDWILTGRYPPATPPDTTPGSGVPQAPNSGWCCFPNGGGFSTNPTACRASKGRFYPDATSSRVCRAPSPNTPLQ